MTSRALARGEVRPARRRLFVLVPLLLLASTPVQKDRSARPSTPTELGTPAGAGATGKAGIAPAAQKAGADASWWQTASPQIERDEYRASATSAGLQAPNRAQGLRTYFRVGGIEVVPRQEPRTPASTWRFAWRTTGWGRAGQMHAVEGTPYEPNVDGTRVCYARGGLDEWYENKKEGLEQGFTVKERPAGEGALRIVGEMGGGLRAEPRAAEHAVDFLDASGARVLRYGELQVKDAHGRELPSRLELTGSEVALVVEDAAAAYPLTVDPLMTSPAWTAESDQASAEFGLSVATAGDVNGDGFSDVIVGAYLYDTGQANAGRAYVYLGSAAGLSANPAWTAQGDQFNEGFGISVATAGDVNGDAYSDVIVGAYQASNGQIQEGRAFVYSGSSSGLSGNPAWTAESDQGQARFGISVATAGDVNGDGYSDVIVGADRYDTTQTDAGRAYVYLGSASGLELSPAWTAEGDLGFAYFGDCVATAGDVNGDGYSDVIVGAEAYFGRGRASVYLGSSSGLATSASWTKQGDQDTVYFGHSVGTAGDVNGDGYSDVVVGAPGYDHDQVDEGRAYAYLGSSSGLAASPALIAEGNQVSAYFGVSVGTAGDVNGDGYADVIVGARWFDNGQTDEGEAYLYLGSPQGLLLSSFAQGNQDSAHFGESVATAGDVNGDGYSDVIVGAPDYDHGQTDEGRAFVYLGSASGPDLGFTSVWTSDGDQAQARFAYSVCSAGDVNGDGYSDVIVGAPWYDSGGTDAGRAFVFHGSASGLAASPAWTADGDQASALFGIVGTAGDVNGDGYSDVIVGAPAYDHPLSDEGRAYVYLGSPSGLAVSPAWIEEGNQVQAFFGHRVGTAGDVNGDGYSDVIVSASGANRAYVYLGSPSGLATTPVWTGQGDNEVYGDAVGTAGDVNGDGYSDVIVGASWYGTPVQRGRVLVYFGSASGPSASADWTQEGGPNDAHFGSSVGTAGDVNGDGYSDVIIGDPDYTDDLYAQGQASVYLGSASGLSTSAAWTAKGDQDTSLLGASVGTAGDVNGDGYSEVIVGAPYYDFAATDDGTAYMYAGSSSGPGLSPVFWGYGGGQDGAAFGQSVAAAGDVNGDGYADVIVGAASYHAFQTNAGRAYLFYGQDRLIGAPGLTYTPRQLRSSGAAPIALLGRSDSESAFRAEATGRTPAGRGRVRLQVEAKPFGTPFDGVGLVTGPWMNTGAPSADGSVVDLSELADGLTLGLYHWRLRISTDSPFFVHSRWLSIPGNALTEADVRLTDLATGVPSVTSARLGMQLDPVVPNPFADRSRLSYALPRRGAVRLAVYDVAGREVVELFHGMAEAGRHVAEWDGLDANGGSVSAGVYFARLTFEGKSEARKIVLVR